MATIRDLDVQQLTDSVMEQVISLQRDIHSHPEIGFDTVRTAALVAENLREAGIETREKIGKTGVVGDIVVPGASRCVAFRADMDALPLQEKNTFDHASSNPGKMHACGHDGHTAMLLGAAKYLASNKNFKGTVNFIFQPAEEGGGGGDLMVKEGLFEKFPVDSVYGLHNWPGMDPGIFGVGSGPIMAAADMFDLTINGRGGHCAMPDQCIDPIVVASQVVSALQTIPSRSTHPVDSVVISVTQIHAGDAYNVIPDSVRMHGSVRTFLPETQEGMPSSMLRVAEGVCAAFGASCELNYIKGYPATINSVPETEISAKAVVDLVGEENLIRDPTPSMGAEDFSYMLQARPGCYVWLGIGTGKGEGGCMLHSSHYDFNDDVLSTGASYWATLVENELAA